MMGASPNVGLRALITDGKPAARDHKVVGRGRFSEQTAARARQAACR